MEIDVMIECDESNLPLIESIGRSRLTEVGEKKYEQYARIDPRIGRLFLLGTVMSSMLRAGHLPSGDMFVMMWGMKDEVKGMGVCQRDERVRGLCSRTELLLAAGLRAAHVAMRLIQPREPRPNEIN